MRGSVQGSSHRIGRLEVQITVIEHRNRCRELMNVLTLGVTLNAAVKVLWMYFERKITPINKSIHSK